MAENTTDMGRCYFLTEVMQVPEGPTYVTAIITCILNSIFSLTATVSNTILLLIILRHHNLHTPPNVLLGCLALSDFVIGSITQPAYVTYKVAEILVLKRVSCVARVIHWVAGWICAGVSMMTITALAVERFLALHLHLRYVVVVTVSKVLLAAILFWVSAILIIMSLFVLESDQYWTFVPAPILLLNLVITFTAYWKIFRILQKHRSQIHDQLQAQVFRHSGNQTGSESINIKRYRKSAVTSMYVLVLLLLCYVPFFCAMVTRVVVGYSAAVKIAYETGATIVYLNSTLNPILFCFRVPDLRREVKNLFSGMDCLKRKPTPVVNFEPSNARNSKSFSVFDRPEIKALYW